MAEPANGENLRNVEIAKIRENPIALREANVKSATFMELVDNIRTVGILNPIVLRELKDPDNGEEYYGLVDGLQRFTAAKLAGLKVIPAQIRSLNDGEVLEAQLMANIHKVETRPVEYSRQLKRILTGNPMMPMSELATRLSKSPTWLHERLGLLKLDPKIAILVDENRINLTNGYTLAKLPPDEQANFLDRAITMQPQEFVPTVNARVKEIRDAKRQAKDVEPEKFSPVPYLQKVADLKNEIDNPKIGPVLCRLENVKKPEDGFALGIKWALHLDTQSVEAAKIKDAERKQQLIDAKAKREKERKEAKAKAAAEEAEKLKQEAEAIAVAK
jgi:ParB family transcriptional regulator, chromosome partitioning protein